MLKAAAVLCDGEVKCWNAYCNTNNLINMVNDYGGDYMIINNKYTT